MSQEFHIPMSARERLDDFHRKVRDYSDGRPDPGVSLSLMDKAKGVINHDGLVVQVLGDYIDE